MRRTATVTNAGDVRLKGRFNCTAAGVVYVITYQRCYMLYIGETSRRLSDHFGEHPRSVEGFKQNPRYQRVGSPWPNTAIFPNTTTSMTCECLWFTRQVKGETATREREEQRLIFQLGTLAPGGLNIDIDRFFNSSSNQRQCAHTVFVKCINAIAHMCINIARKL